MLSDKGYSTFSQENAKKIRQKGSYCSANGCGHCKSINRNLSFFRFPKQKERCKTWVSNCGRVDLHKQTSSYLYENCRLCSQHFTDNQFMSLKKDKLVWNAVPTIFSNAEIIPFRKPANNTQPLETKAVMEAVNVNSVLCISHDHPYSTHEEKLGRPNPALGLSNANCRANVVDLKSLSVEESQSDQACVRDGMKKQATDLIREQSRNFHHNYKVSNMPNTCAVATYLNVLWQRSGTSFPKTDQTVRLRKGAESSVFNLRPHLQKVTKECKNRKLVYKSSSLDHSVEHGGLQSSSSNDMKQDSYDCVICGKRFGSRGTLKNHLKIHANVLFTNEGKAVLVKTESQPEEMELEKCFVVDGLVGEDGVIGAVKSENLENDTDTVTNAEQKDLAVCIKRERDDALVYGNIEITEEVICKTEPFEMTDSLNS